MVNQYIPDPSDRILIAIHALSFEPWRIAVSRDALVRPKSRHAGVSV